MEAHEIQHMIQGLENMSRGGAAKDFFPGGGLYSKKMPWLSENEMYRRLAGEWEARNAGLRSILPANDPRLGNAMAYGGTTFRTGKPFSTADDIPLNDLIVRMGE
jgi:hypothetical protein